jgi:hypothetical protein
LRDDRHARAACSGTDEGNSDYVFERSVFQGNGKGRESLSGIDAYKRGSFIREAKQGHRATVRKIQKRQADLDLLA